MCDVEPLSVHCAVCGLIEHGIFYADNNPCLKLDAWLGCKLKSICAYLDSLEVAREVPDGAAEDDYELF